MTKKISNIEKFKTIQLHNVERRVLEVLERKKFIASIKELSDIIEEKKYGSIYNAVNKLHKKEKLIVEKYYDKDYGVEKKGIFIDEETKNEMLTSYEDPEKILRNDIDVVEWVNRVSFGSVRFIKKLKKIVMQDAISIRDSILGRDNHMCQLCESKDDIEVHHIISVDDYIGFFFSQLDKNNAVESVNFFQRQSVNIINHPSNLITLCKECHSGIIPQFKFKLSKLATNQIEQERRKCHQSHITKYFGGV